MATNEYNWVPDAQKALKWFIETIGLTEWSTRRKKVVEYFEDLEKKMHSETKESFDSFAKFEPVAFYGFN